MNPEVLTFLTAMTPFGELRASIPLGVSFNLPLFTVFILSIIGNLVPPIFILLFLNPVSNWLSKKSKLIERFFLWLFERTRNRTNDKIKKYGPFALVFFVAIPFPLTGAYTGAIAAYLFNIPAKKAFPLIVLGVIIAGIIVSLIIETGVYLNPHIPNIL